MAGRKHAEPVADFAVRDPALNERVMRDLAEQPFAGETGRDERGA